jgi:N-acetylglucosaminyl-diphospho-decaprenol L-rhamnosyltransferase
MMISFLIVNWNGGEVFKRCLLSIQQMMLSLPRDYEIIVVDNASADLDVDWLSLNVPHLKLFKNSENELFAKGTNQTVAAASGELLCIINNDIIFHDGCISELVNALEKYECDVVVPKMLNPDGSIQRSIRNFPTLTGVLASAVGLDRLGSTTDKWLLHRFNYNHPSPVQQPMFSAMLLPIDTWNKVGDLDEDFPILFNDVDWFKRFSEKRLKAYYVPAAVVTHVHGMSVNRNKVKKVYTSTIGMYRYFKKHGSSGLLHRSLLLFVLVFTFFGRLISELLIKRFR